MSERLPESPVEQLGIPREAIYEAEEPEALMTLRNHLLEEAQRNLSAAWEITDVLVSWELEPKSRKRRVMLV